MEKILEILLWIVAVLVSLYYAGRIFTKGALHEIDKFLLKKFNQIKTKKDGTEEKK